MERFEKSASLGAEHGSPGGLFSSSFNEYLNMYE